jgi:hypothetical protein
MPKRIEDRQTGDDGSMALPVSLILIAVGLVLALAVHPSDSSTVDVNTVGWILFAVGAVGGLLTLLFWDSWAGSGYWRRRRAYPAAGPTQAAPPPAVAPPAAAPQRRTTVVEEDIGPPPAEPL